MYRGERDTEAGFVRRRQTEDGRALGRGRRV